MSAKIIDGNAIGKEARIVTGCSQLSKSDARIMYMKIKESKKAIIKLVCISSMYFEWPTNWKS